VDYQYRLSMLSSTASTFEQFYQRDGAGSFQNPFTIDYGPFDAGSTSAPIDYGPFDAGSTPIFPDFGFSDF